MGLREAVAVVIVLKCLILMVATQSVKAGSCIDASNEIQLCGSFELVKLTVLEREDLEGREYISFRIDEVFKSDSHVTAGTEGFFRFPNGHACLPNLIPDIQYVLMAQPAIYSPDEIELCIREPDQIPCSYVSIPLVVKESTTL